MNDVVDKHWIKEGIAVTHVSNSKVVMTVERLCYRHATINCSERDEGAYYNSEVRGFVKVKKILLGVICRWIDNNGTLHNAEFHSRELRPYSDGPNSK